MTSERPFVDRPVGELEPAAALARRVARELGLPAPELMRTGMNALFRAGDVVVRVGRPSAPAALSIELAERLRAHGIAAAEPATDDVFDDDGGLAATCWVALAGAQGATDWRAVGQIVRRVHRLADADIPSGYPVPSPTTFPWWDFDGMLADVGDEIDAAARAGLETAIEAGREWTVMPHAETVICHGDVHPGNVMMTADGAVLLDWDLVCRAPAAWDHAMLLTLAERWGGDPGAYEAFAEGYGVSMIGDPVTERLATLRNVAATLMRVRAGRTDPSARAEAERRLRYWRGDPDAPTWNAQ